MTDGANLIYNILNVEASNYPTYGTKPSIKIERQQSLFTKKTSKGIEIANGSRNEILKATNNTVFARKNNVIITVSETTITLRDNLFKDVLDLFKDQPIAELDFEHDETYPKPHRIIMDLMIWGVHD